MALYLQTIKEQEPYFFSIPEVNLWGHILKREDMSLVFYEPEDIEAIRNIFKDLSDPNLSKIYERNREYYIDTVTKLYNINIVMPRQRVSSIHITQQIADKWSNALIYFKSLKSTDYVQFVNYCTSFLKHELHTFIFFVPNYRMSSFSANKDVELHYYWRLALNR
jgi:hypothetical protein